MRCSGRSRACCSAPQTCMCKLAAGDSCTCKSCTCGPYALFFSTLANENRLYILTTLRDKPKSVSQIVTATGIEQTHVSHALKHLQRFGFVTSRR